MQTNNNYDDEEIIDMKSRNVTILMANDNQLNRFEWRTIVNHNDRKVTYFNTI